MKTRILTGLFFILFLLVFNIPVTGQEKPGSHEVVVAEHSEEKFDASLFIIEHISDSHEWHILTKKNGEHVSIPLPVILYHKTTGLHFFLSNKLAHGHTYKDFKFGEGEFEGRIVEVNEAGEVDTENMPLDFSMTKTVVGMLAAALIGLWLFISLSRSYKKSGISHPRGIQSFLEPVICFLRDEVVIPNIGYKEHERFMPYLLSVFFFILINNIMGLIPFPPPFGANVTGNIAVTMTLALFSFVIIQVSGTRSYWRHIFATPGVPFWLLPIMIPVELIGMIAKPFALTVRLFANITAGHIIVMSLLALIFIFDSVAVAPVSIFFVIFMDCLELLVAFLQAYVFTLLSALFISLAIVKEHH
ncbi:MAG: ATP synthase F0 subunit A [Bacteroidetes bacterium RBG_19FT_COMBO_42_7]|nr:MAG: ATP synthase F0 subunit A [Bacteroidetes bacterium RBG_19FT_COMBO_42_7]